jgi:CRP-like cAMP-binding protein/ActR/RegA family two-component response regulator
MTKILIIDDDSVFRKVSAEVLKVAGYEVELAEDGKAGVIIAQSTLPDLILCDVKMSDLDGYGVLKILSKTKETAAIPFIFISSLKESKDIRKGLYSGSDDYLIKPVEPSELIDSIEKRLERIKLWNDNISDKGFNRLFKYKKIDAFLSAFFADRKLKSLKKKDKLYYENDFANHTYYIVSGKIKTVKTDSYGKEYVTDILLPGNILGFLPIKENGEHRETAIAMEASILSVVPKHEFTDFLKREPSFSYALIEFLAENMAEKENRMLQLAYATVKERVAETLLYFHDKNLDTNPISGISRDDLASIVGTTKESLVRALSEFKKDGSIKSSTKNIAINDIKTLRRNSSFFSG